MENKFIPVAMFMMLIMSSLFSVHHNYSVTKNGITADLNHALVMTLNNGVRSVITQDTIKAYKQLRASSADGRVLIAVSDERFCRFLGNRKLRNNSFITFDVVDDNYNNTATDNSVISSDTIILNEGYGGDVLAVRGYARLSSAAIFEMSDQRMSLAFAISALLWAVLSIVYIKRSMSVKCNTDFGGLSYSEDNGCFYGNDNSTIHFTPMQHKLVMMFWNSPNHSLTKEEICDELWPKKIDANDTLYTLMKRLKVVVETNTCLSIVSDRGKCYSLKIRKIDG